MPKTSTTTPPRTPTIASETELDAYCNRLANQASAASEQLTKHSGSDRSAALHNVAERLLNATDAILSANAKDVDQAQQNGLTGALLSRLGLDESRIAKMAESVRQIADQTDPVGQVIEGYTRPNGLQIQKVRAPLGVVLFIFESRPNVTSDAAALCIKSGNTVVLRGGKEALQTNTVVADCVSTALADAGLSRDCVQLVETTDRAVVGKLLKMVGRIDLAIPRGGESLIQAVVAQAHIPVIKHYTGNCHVYIDKSCDDAMASDICVNAKIQSPGVCNAAETILIHRAAAERGLATRICQALVEQGCQIRGDQATRDLFPPAIAATDADWGTEHLDLIVTVGVIDSLDAAINHINRYGSKHTDAIVTNRLDAAQAFERRVDSANVFVNCSTRFSDGGEYGLGAEIGISTDKLHARGPMGAADLTTYKWIVRGTGQVRQ